VSEAAATFWNQRYRDHSACWGEDGSPTLQLALKHFPAAGHALEIGYGYGRDLVTLARRGLVVTGIDPSGEGQHMAEARLAALGVKMVTLLTADFTEARLLGRPAGSPTGSRPSPSPAPWCASARETCATSTLRA
jgi:tRNA G46 methylase TrmB